MKKKLWQYGVCSAIGAVLSVFVMAFEGLFGSSGLSAKDVMAILCDAFFFSGALMASFGGLAWIASTGFFDMISYAINVGAHSLLPFIKLESRTFYDYKEAKAKKRGSAPRFILVVGLIFVALSVIPIIIRANL
ncbi:MAG: DUF3899 domain-containing protein [Clostridia bacterium]|nr:DUF3899 domain-containing protein [Clostridia bacterium]